MTERILKWAAVAVALVLLYRHSENGRYVLHSGSLIIDSRTGMVDRVYPNHVVRR